MSSNTIEWSKFDEVGVLNILTLSEQTYFIPEFKSQDFMGKIMYQKNDNKMMQDLELLVNRLSRHMSSLKESQLPTGQITSEILRQCNLSGLNMKELKKAKT